MGITVITTMNINPINKAVYLYRFYRVYNEN